MRGNGEEIKTIKVRGSCSHLRVKALIPAGYSDAYYLVSSSVEESVINVRSKEFRDQLVLALNREGFVLIDED